jgi:hypothetical protein
VMLPSRTACGLALSLKVAFPLFEDAPCAMLLWVRFAVRSAIVQRLRVFHRRGLCCFRTCVV